MSVADGLMILQVEIETLKTEDRRNHRVRSTKFASGWTGRRSRVGYGKFMERYARG
jgi:hypothetical protein